MSPDTIYYIHWRGRALITSAETKNHLLQLLEDPDLAPMREAAIRSLKKSVESAGNTGPTLELPDILSLLDNPAVLGIVATPPSKTPSSDAPATLVGFFFVYDSTGKADLVRKLKAANQASGREVPTVLSYEFGGVNVEARTNGTNVTYTAQTKSYYLIADQKRVMEDLIARFQGAPKPAVSLTQLPEYAAMRTYLWPDAAVKFFGHVPDLNKWITPERRDKPAGQVLQNLHLEKIHAAGGSISFAGEATRMRGAILGDTSAGSLFDILGPSRTSFLVQPVVSPGPIFSIYRIDLAAMYQLICTASAGALTVQQSASLGMYENLAQNFLGMPIADALHLFTGEFGTEYTFAEDGSLQTVFAVSIQKPHEVLRILRAIVGGMIVGENTAGDITYLDISYPYRDSATGSQRRKFYYIAVTPQAFYAAPRKSMLRETMARASSESGAGPAKNNSPSPEMEHLRGLLPERLSGLTGADMTLFPWDKFSAALSQQMAEDAKRSQNPNPPPDWLKSIKPESFSRHLHGAVSGYWKDSNGVYFDSYIE